MPLRRLEPYAVKVARTVLRRVAPGNRCRLSDKNVFQRMVKKNHKCLASSELCERHDWLYYFTLPSFP
ncbi:hypothetical protein CWO28_12295 [Vibrio splendidus]|nr:hypothetical protein CWO28_12295 [Vibrio splendidus]